jgi:hypothetical protein
MADPDLGDDTRPPASLGRPAVVKTAAWSVPVIAAVAVADRAASEKAAIPVPAGAAIL